MNKYSARKLAVTVAAGVVAITLGVVVAATQLGSHGASVVTQNAGASRGTSSSSAAAPVPTKAAATAAGPGGASGGASAGSTGAGAGSTTSAGDAQGAGHPATGAAASTAPTSPRPTTPVGTAAPTTTTPAPAASGPAPATPGTYRYHQVGSLPGTPSQGTLVVAPASASGTQLWTRNVGGSLPSATTSMLFNASGSFLLTPSDPVTGSATCSFATPVPWPPWPTTAGRSTSAQASCTGPITTYQVTSHVQGTAQAVLAGAPVTVDVVVNTFVIKGSYNGSAIDVTFTETDEYTPNLRVPVVTTTHLTGTALGISVTTQRTDTLESATPS